MWFSSGADLFLTDDINFSSSGSFLDGRDILDVGRLPSLDLLDDPTVEVSSFVFLQEIDILGVFAKVLAVGGPAIAVDQFAAQKPNGFGTVTEIASFGYTYNLSGQLIDIDVEFGFWNVEVPFSEVIDVFFSRSTDDDQELYRELARGNDVFFGGTGSATLRGFEGDDWFFGRGGSDALDGGAGTDTAVYVSASNYYTLEISNVGIFITDRSPFQGITDDFDEGRDRLIDIEKVNFDSQGNYPVPDGGGPLFEQSIVIENFADIGSLSQEEMLALTEMYIA